MEFGPLLQQRKLFIVSENQPPHLVCGLANRKEQNPKSFFLSPHKGARWLGRVALLAVNTLHATFSSSSLQLLFTFRHVRSL